MKMFDAKSVLHALNTAGKTLATAESCTGGWVGKMLTDVPGSSKSYKGGVISYTNEVKHRVLGVSNEVLSAYGAVSEQTAKAMAKGVCCVLDADIGASVTGLAGPDGDGSGRSVGLVYIAVCDGVNTVCRELHLSGDRISIREQACCQLFALILSVLKVG